MASNSYWQALDDMISSSEMIIDRPKGSAHPRFPSLIYPLDYGYLADTASMDGDGIDVWRGSDPAQQLNAVVCTVDLRKRDSEIKLLIGCTDEETAAVLAWHNDSDMMKAILIRR